MSFEAYLDGYYDVENQLPEYLKNQARIFFEREEGEKRSISSVEEFEKRRDHVWKYFLKAIGDLDIPKTPLLPVCTGEIDREGYVIKKIIFQSQPRVYVTSNLYVPKGITGKAPAVLFACGHGYHAKGNDPYQKVCIDLVHNGFVVLAVDPVGQGERMQYYDRNEDRLMVDWGTTEHCYAGFQCELTGTNIARYFIWDLVRALDYLCTLPEVDTERIGMTGASGGGTQTAYMMLVEDRLKTAVPCNYITSREDYMKTGQAHDSEQNIFGSIIEGPNNDDFVACFAPRPAMIGSVDSDFFAIEGVAKSFERVQHVYNLYGCPERAKWYLAKGTHAYNDELRQAAVNWFKVWLKGEEGDFVTDPGMKVEAPQTLWCTRSGQVLGDYEDVRTVFDLNLEYYNNLKASQKNGRSSMDRAVIRKSLEEVLNMPRDKSAIYPRTIRKVAEGDVISNYVFFFSQKDVAVSGIYIEKTERPANTCTVLLLEEGTNGGKEYRRLVQKFLQKGDVFVFDPRGVGAVKNRKINKRSRESFYGTEAKLNMDAMMMKTSLTALRVYDVLRAIDYIRQTRPEMEITLAGKGVGAIHALLAGALRDEVKEVFLEDMIPSWGEMVTTRYYRYDARLGMYGVLKKLDIPDILQACSDKRFTFGHSPDTGGIWE